MDLSQKRILVTGGHGFLGQHVIDALVGHGCELISHPPSSYLDLRKEADREELFDTYRPDVVIHMAAVLGGIGAHMHTQGQYLYENLSMGLGMLEQARRFGVKKYVNIGTSCSYPDAPESREPLREEDLWKGFPNKTTAPYGVAKLALMYQGQTYREQYGMNCITVIPANVYGPKDHFDPEKSHVIPALITNCLAAAREDKPFVVWGTGKATREFIYASDCAEGIVRAAEDYDGYLPINLGTGIETPIRDVVHFVAHTLDFKGAIHWDESKPDGCRGRVFDVQRAKDYLKFEAKVSVHDGIRRTIDWYLQKVRGNG